MQLRIERRMFLNMPWGLLATALGIALLGIWNLASAGRDHPAPVWTNQAVYLVLALLAMFAVALLDLRFLHRMAVPIYVLSLLSLIALRFVGHTAKGAESWFVLGPIRIQPAEFTKLAMVLMLAKYFHDDYRASDDSYGFFRLLPPIALALVPFALVLAQPDLGTALMLFFTALTMALFARPRWYVSGILALAVVLGSVVIWNDWVRDPASGRQTLVRHQLKKHQERRITGWLDPESDLKGANYHAAQSKIAVGSGGITGKGWKKGTQTGLRFLPEQHTDFIFSVWAEEHGFLFCLLLLMLYGAIVVTSLGVAVNARDRFGAFIVVGVTAMIFWQVFENIGMVTGLLPVTGITLPLMSYGGSSLLSVMMGLGLVVNVGVRRHIF